MSLVNGLRQENADLRFRTGSGAPEGNVLLGGSLKGEGTDTTFGGAGFVGSASRLARINRDVRLARVASGDSRVPGGGTGRFGDNPGAGDNSGGIDPATGRPRIPRYR